MAVAKHEVRTATLAGLDLATARFRRTGTSVAAAGPFRLLGPLGVAVSGVDGGVPNGVGAAIGQTDHVGGRLNKRLDRLDMPRLRTPTDVAPEALVGLGKLRDTAPIVVPVGESSAGGEDQRLAGLSVVGPVELRALGGAVPHHEIRGAVGQQPRRVDDAAGGHQVVAGIAVVVLHVLDQRQADLAQIVHAASLIGPRFGLRQGRQQHAGEDGDDGDDHQQLDQGEGGPGTQEWLHGAIGEITFTKQPIDSAESIPAIWLFGVSLRSTEVVDQGDDSRRHPPESNSEMVP